ncbi:histidine--tRNA ligase [Prochlorococcus marinus]|uniref:histidine--tRNA ligase n=1 Tax=Prochlorococcus marinus TaxID=1219 RepID=UPI0022B51211|nr:histidine--tRNA ligase [Prochlorococcus marinus]
MTNFQTLRGMPDLLPSQTECWQKVEDLARNHFLRAGLKEIRTPLLEQTELFNRGIGENTDVVGKEMYSFLDRGNRPCTLRPEGTASVVRAVIQNGLLNQGAQRLWYNGPMFRYERPQAGRQRQFHQIGVEFFGLSSVRSDAEIITIAWDFLNELGIQGLSLQINTLGTMDDRKKYRKELVTWLENVFDFLDEDSQRKLKSNPLRILDSKNPKIQEMLDEAPVLMDYLSNESEQRFLKLQSILSKLKIPFQLNLKLVRGLDYYCHTAFEIISDQLGAQATVCGGGRYDTLVEQLGGISTPSIGWAIGMERLLILLGDDFSTKTSTDVYIINRGEDVYINALVLAREIRLANFSVELDYSGSAISKQFKRANKSSASWVIILGENDLSNDEVRIKSLNTKHENIKQHISKITDINYIINIISL